MNSDNSSLKFCFEKSSRPETGSNCVRTTFSFTVKTMAGYDNDYWNNQNQQQKHQSFNFEMPEQFGQEL